MVLLRLGSIHDLCDRGRIGRSDTMTETADECWEDGGTVDLTQDGLAVMFPYLVKKTSDSGWPIAVVRTAEHRDAILRDHEQAHTDKELAGLAHMHYNVTQLDLLVAALKESREDRPNRVQSSEVKRLLFAMLDGAQEALDAITRDAPSRGEQEVS